MEKQKDEIQKSRELLGKEGEKYTDKQILEMNDTMRLLANLIIDRYLDDKKNGKLLVFKNGENIQKV